MLTLGAATRTSSSFEGSERDEAQPGGRADAPVCDFDSADAGPARRSPHTLGRKATNPLRLCTFVHIVQHGVRVGSC